MHRKSSFRVLTVLLLLFGGMPMAIAGPVLRGFLCTVDLPPFDSKTVDTTSVYSVDSQLTCGGNGNIHLKCRAPLSTQEFMDLGGKTKTYKNTPCQINKRLCSTSSSASDGIVSARKSELVINKNEAKIECQL